jgi:hypothetical protein
MNWIKRHSSFVLFCSSLIFALILAELLLRLMGIGYGNSPMESHPRLHHLHPTNYSYVVHDPAGEYGGHRIYLDHEGYRVPDPDIEVSKSTPTRTVAFLGDSFTEGNELAWKDSLIGLIQKENPSIAVRNFGVSSYSPIQYLAQTRKELIELKPTDVVMQLYSNDFDSDHEYLVKADTHDLDKLQVINGDGKKMVIALLRHSYLARLIRKIQLQVDFYINAPAEPPPFPEEVLYFDELALKRRQLTYTAILKIRDEVNQQGAKFYLMLIPNKGLAMKGQCCKTDRLYQEVAGFTKENKINMIQLDNAFEQSKNQRTLFFPRDIHLTKDGNIELAASISQSLELNQPVKPN